MSPSSPSSVAPSPGTARTTPPPHECSSTTGPTCRTSTTSRPSTGTRSNLSTSSRADGHASRSPSPAKGKVPTMSAHSGRTSPQPFAWFDPDSCSWRTSQPSLPLENLPEPQPAWPRSGTWDLGHACERPTSAHPTAANASSSSLPTPRATRGGSSTETVDLLPTPRATDGTKGGPNQRGSSGDLMLPSAVQLLPTPLTDPAAGNGHARTLSSEAKLLPTPTAREGNSRGAGHPDRRKALNPKRGGGQLDEVAVHLLPTPTAMASARNRTANRTTPYDPRSHNSLTLLDVFWNGDPTDSPSDAGNTSSDDQPPHPPNPTATANPDSDHTSPNG